MCRSCKNGTKKFCIPFPQNIHLLIFYIFRLFLLPSFPLQVYSVVVNNDDIVFFWTAWEQVADMLSSLLIIQVYISPKEGHSLIEMSYNHAGQFHHYHGLLRLRLHIANCPHHCHFFLSFFLVQGTIQGPMWRLVAKALQSPWIWSSSLVFPYLSGSRVEKVLAFHFVRWPTRVCLISLHAQTRAMHSWLESSSNDAVRWEVASDVTTGDVTLHHFISLP